MKNQSIATISAILLAVMLFISPAWGESSGVQRVSYETFVDLQIQHNEFKSTLGSPNTPNLRKIAEDARIKADFLRENRDALVSSMGSHGIENKPYKMVRRLNQVFYGSVRPGGSVTETAAIDAFGPFIDKLIRHSKFKASLGSEKTPNLLKSAEVSREKAEFLHANRDRLIGEMEADNVEKKAYKMTHYLNRTFYDTIRDDGTLLIADAAGE